MRFEVFQIATLELDTGGWRWRLRADNDEILAYGDQYSTLRKCLESIVRTHEGLPDIPVVFAATGMPIEHA